MIKSSPVYAAPLLLLAWASNSALGQNATLSFVKSPVTGMHIALQPRLDHHRIHALVRIENGGGKRYEAEVACLARGVTTSSSVRFTALTNDQAWAIYLRTPKLPDTTAQYTFELRPEGNDGEPLVYMWEIVRESDGTTEIVKPVPGQTSTFSYIVGRPVQQQQDDGTLEWSIVYETRMRTVTVPAGFVFDVDQQNNEAPGYAPAEPVN